MKAENLMMQPGAKPAGAAPGGKTSSLRSAVQSKTAAQSAKADKNDFGSALDNAKNAQKDVKAEPEKAPKTEAQDTKQPKRLPSFRKTGKKKNPGKRKTARSRKPLRIFPRQRARQRR